MGTKLRSFIATGHEISRSFFATANVPPGPPRFPIQHTQQLYLSQLVLTNDLQRKTGALVDGR